MLRERREAEDCSLPLGIWDGSRRSLVPRPCCNAQAASLRRLQIALPALREIDDRGATAWWGDHMP